MRICIISTQIFPLGSRGLSGYGGLEQIAWECARGLAARGHQTTLIAPIGSECPGVEVVQCLPPGSGEEAAYGGCVYKNSNNEEVRWPGYWSKLLECNDNGVVICHDWQKWAYMLKAEGRLKAPVLGVMHAPINTMYGSLPPVDKPCIVCISKDQCQRFDVMFSPAKARVCYNGIDTTVYQSLNAPRSNRFLFLARFSLIKGAALALEACQKADADIDLIGDTQITGEPDYYQMCCRMADGVKRRIIGGVPRGETVWWYSQALALLHPVRNFCEPFGLAPVEAMACETPVIAWRNGAMPETVVNGETGWLVDNMDDFVLRIEDFKHTISEYRKRMGERCREHALQFSLENMVTRYEELCEEALSTGGW